jgi:hypothetical protein
MVRTAFFASNTSTSKLVVETGSPLFLTSSIDCVMNISKRTIGSSNDSQLLEMVRCLGCVLKNIFGWQGIVRGSPPTLSTVPNLLSLVRLVAPQPRGRDAKKRVQRNSGLTAN